MARHNTQRDPPAVKPDRGTLTVNTAETELQLMKFEHEGPDGANFRDTSASKAVRWEDRDEARRWLLALLVVMKDLRGAARDRVRRKRRRVLSRYEARRQIADAWRRLMAMIRAAEAGLDGPGPREPEPLPEEGTGGDAPPFSSRRPTNPPEAAG